MSGKGGAGNGWTSIRDITPEQMLINRQGGQNNGKEELPHD